jgi:hypothetical protein
VREQGLRVGISGHGVTECEWGRARGQLRQRASWPGRG